MGVREESEGGEGWVGRREGAREGGKETDIYNLEGYAKRGGEGRGELS